MTSTGDRHNADAKPLVRTSAVLAICGHVSHTHLDPIVLTYEQRYIPYCHVSSSLEMAHMLRGKQAGVHRDFSAGLHPQLFAIDEVSATSWNIFHLN